MSGRRLTGADWISDVPAHWGFVPAKALFAERRESSGTGDDHLTPSQKFGVMRQSEYMEATGARVVLNLTGADNMKHVEPDDFVIHLRSFQGGIERSELRGKVSLAYTVLRPRSTAHSRYFKYVLKSDRYIQALRVVVNQLRDGQSIRYQDFAKIPLPVPPIEEQAAIADFLDRETAKIDALIERQTEQIDALRSRLREATRRACLEGLAPSHMEPTPYWFGQLPTTWKAVRLSHVCDITLGKMKNGGIDQKDSTPIPFLAAGSIQPETLVLDQDRRMPFTWREQRQYDLLRGDIVVVEGGAGFGRSYVLREPLPGWGFQNHVARVRPRTQSVDSRYLRAVIETCRVSGFFEANNRTATLPSLSRETLGALRVPMPTSIEQRSIADHLDQLAESVARTIEQTERFIALAQERRSALITAAVTGQLNIGEAA